MKVTRVRVKKINPHGKLKAWASVTFDDCFVVHDVRVLEDERGIFIAMPSKKISNGEFIDIAHPINRESRDMLVKAVLEEYQRTP